MNKRASSELERQRVGSCDTGHEDTYGDIVNATNSSLTESSDAKSVSIHISGGAGFWDMVASAET